MKEVCLQHTSQQRKLCCAYKTFKTSIKSWLILKKVHRVIQFNQEPWLKPYINTNTKLRADAKNGFEKDFFQTNE